ncbi:MAG: hypothetical protein AB8F78_15870 [Saprospiraceae bacterium]
MCIPYLFLSILLFAFVTPCFSQGCKYLTNPSFEDTPRQNQALKGWEDCGQSNESPVDVHGSYPDSTLFGVKEHAEHGETFLGMVVRDNGTYEGVSARLLQPLLKDTAYKLTVMVKQSPTYHSVSRSTNKPMNYDQPVLLEIWGGLVHCQKITLLAEYKVDNQDDWTETTFYFTPERNIRYLGLYARHTNKFYDNGNALLDNLQIVKVDAVTLEER